MPQKVAAAGRVLLVALLLCAFVCAQSSALSSEHSHQHPSQHCCGLCHAGPLPLLQPTISATLAPVLSMSWLEWTADMQSPHQVLLTAGSSRAPPASSQSLG